MSNLITFHPMPKTNVIGRHNLTEAEVIAAVDKYFAGVDHTVRTSRSYGEQISLYVQYYDFKPRRQVRNDIEDIAPNIFVEVIEREYSDNSYALAFHEMSEERREVFVRMADGSMQAVHIDHLIVEYLEHRVLSKNLSQDAA